MSKKARDWRLEALRLLSMFFIVATHFSGALFNDRRLGAGVLPRRVDGKRQLRVPCRCSDRRASPSSF